MPGATSTAERRLRLYEEKKLIFIISSCGDAKKLYQATITNTDPKIETIVQFNAGDDIDAWEILRAYARQELMGYGGLKRLSWKLELLGSTEVKSGDGLWSLTEERADFLGIYQR